MRKGIVIAGAIILVVGIAVVGVALYLVALPFASANLGANPSTRVLASGQSVTLGATQAGKIDLVTYEDNVSAPIRLNTGSASAISRTVTTSNGTLYLAILEPSSGSSQTVALVNNQTSTVSVRYNFIQSSAGMLASGGLSIIGGAALFVVGLVVLIVGFIMKKKQPVASPQPGLQGP